MTAIQHVNNYQVMAKLTAEYDGNHTSYTLRLLYRGDGTFWASTNAGIEWAVKKEFFDNVKVGEFLSISTSPLNRSQTL